MGDIGKYFDRSEFACKCGCGFDAVDYYLIQKLDDLRMVHVRPIVITSGCRCESHNTKVGGSLNSAHMKGYAADIEVVSPEDMFEILGAIFRIRLFNRIGIGKNFIHVDIDSDKPYKVLWTY